MAPIETADGRRQAALSTADAPFASRSGVAKIRFWGSFTTRRGFDLHAKHISRLLGVVGIATISCGPGDMRPTTSVAPPEAPDASTAMSQTDVTSMDDDAGGIAHTQTCRFDLAFLTARKTCSTDDDCTLFDYQPSCCPTDVRVVGIARFELDEAEACAEAQRTCGCDKEPLPDRAEDGRVVNELSTVVARCIAGQCTSRVTQRECGNSHICEPGELCVSYENVAGGLPPDPDSKDNAILTYRCEPDPCHDRLDCSCAKALCDARDDVPRKCEIKRSADADVVCAAAKE